MYINIVYFTMVKRTGFELIADTVDMLIRKHYKKGREKLLLWNV